MKRNCYFSLNVAEAKKLSLKMLIWLYLCYNEVNVFQFNKEDF